MDKHSKRVAEVGYPWNPDYGWQLLRRNQCYRKAVARFYLQARAVGDDWAVRLVDSLRSYDDAAEPEELKSLKSESITGTERKDLLQETLSKRVWSSSENNIFKSIDLQPSAVYYWEFFDQFGDVILFPIPAEQVIPPIFFLDFVWNFRPAAKIESEQYKSLLEVRRKAKNSSRLKRVGFLPPISINANFPISTIMKQIKQYVSKSSLREIKSTDQITKKIRWPDLEKNLRAWDLHESGKSWNEIGLGIAGQTKKRSNIIDSARNKVDSANRLISIFDR